MPTKTISTFNGVTQTAGVSTNLIVSTNALPSIMAITGYANGAAAGTTQYFLQLFNQATVPANGTVPLASWEVLSTDGFLFNFRDEPLSADKLSLPTLSATAGLILCLSTTEATLTIATGNVTMDCSVDLDSPQGIVPMNQSVAGDTTTLRANLQVAADPSQNKLVSFTAMNNAISPAGYMMLFAKVPSNGDVPIQQWKVLNGATLNANFGGGFFCEQVSATDLSLKTGIYLYGSTTTQTYTSGGGTNWYIQAYYI